MSNYFQYIVEFGVIGMIIVQFITTFTKSGRGNSGELIEFYKKEALDYKDISDKKDIKHNLEIKEITREFNEKIHELTEKVGILQGQYNAEKSEREKYEAIAKDKNPETQEFMKFVIKSCEDQGHINKEVVTILKEIHAMAKAEHDRDFNITAQITKN